MNIRKSIKSYATALQDIRNYFENQAIPPCELFLDNHWRQVGDTIECKYQSINLNEIVTYEYQIVEDSIIRKPEYTVARVSDNCGDILCVILDGNMEEN